MYCLALQCMKLHNLHYTFFQLWLSLILMCHLSSSRTSINFSEDTIFHKAERKIKRHSFSRKKERKLLRVWRYQSFSNKSPEVGSFYGRASEIWNLQYNTLGHWDERLINQASDVPNIIFLYSISCKTLCKIVSIYFFIN